MIDLDQERHGRPRLNLAPLIDVVFLLLVFFMLASSFVELQAIDLALPSPAQGTPAVVPQEPLVVSITRDGEIRLNGLHLDLTQLQSEIAGRVVGEGAKQIAIKAEASVPVQLLVSVMDAISAAGLTNIRLAAPPAE